MASPKFGPSKTPTHHPLITQLVLQPLGHPRVLGCGGHTFGNTVIAAHAAAWPKAGAAHLNQHALVLPLNKPEVHLQKGYTKKEMGACLFWGV